MRACVYVFCACVCVCSLLHVFVCIRLTTLMFGRYRMVVDDQLKVVWQAYALSLSPWKQCLTGGLASCTY